MSYTLRELLVAHIEESRKAVNAAAASAASAMSKTEELCGRLECVEREIIGEIGNPEQVSMRQSLNEVRGYIERQRSRGRWLAGLASGGLVASVVALIKVMWTGGSGR